MKDFAYIAKVLGVTEQRAEQIYRNAINKLKRKMSKQDLKTLIEIMNKKENILH